MPGDGLLAYNVMRQHMRDDHHRAMKNGRHEEARAQERGNIRQEQLRLVEERHMREESRPAEEKMAREAEFQKMLDELACMSMSDGALDRSVTQQNTMWGREMEESDPSTMSKPDLVPTTQLPPAQIHRDLYSELVFLDLDIDEHTSKCVKATSTGLKSPVGSPAAMEAVKTLEEEHRWFRQTKLTVHDLADLCSDAKVQLLYQAMYERLEVQIQSTTSIVQDISMPTIPTSPRGPIPVVDA
ncbi:hypothetical protein FOMPIDRAFT_117929, partial [Fomitopsis schrenkii]